MNGETPPTRRSMCARCLRPAAACLCHWVRPVVQPVEVLILQHPTEVAHPKGTARLLHLSLPGSRLLVGERFDPAVLAEALAGPRRNLLLYPPTAESPDVEVLADMPEPLNAIRLVVLDGTWRKSRKMLHLNPVLATLPRLLLHDLPASRYAVRKARRAGQLSTLEAAVLALAPSRVDGKTFDDLLTAFDGFIATQLRAFQSPRSIVATSDTPSGAS